MHLVTSVAFETLDHVSAHFGKYTNLLKKLREVLLDAVFVEAQALRHDLDTQRTVHLVVSA